MCLHICHRHHVEHAMLLSALLLQAEPATAAYRRHAKYLRLLWIVTQLGELLLEFWLFL